MSRNDRQDINLTWQYILQAFPVKASQYIQYYQRKRNRYLDYTQIIKLLIDIEGNNSRFFEQTKSFIECNETSQQILNNSEMNKTPITTEKIETNNTLLRINNKKTFPKQD